MKQRRLCDEHMAVLDQRTHEAEEECQQQGADMAAVHIGIGHQDDLAVTQLCEVKIITEAPRRMR